MKRPIWAAVITVVMTVTIGTVPAHAAAALGTTAAAETTDDPVAAPLYDETAGGGTVRVNVVTKSRTDLPGAAAIGTMMQSFRTLPVVTLKVDEAGLEKLAAQPGVVSVTEDTPVPPSLDQSIPLIGGTSPAAAGFTGTGSAIAVLDTGVATHHPFLKDRIVAEACFSPIDPDYSATSLCPNGTEEQEGTGSADSETGPCAAIAECDHGTHVAGIAAGNGEGISGAPARGVAPGAGIVAIQVFSQFNSEDFCGSPEATPCVGSFTSAQLAGLEKVLQLKQSGTPVIAANLSLGTGRYTTACDNSPHTFAIDSLFAAGVATVIAAGNNGYTDAVSAPACVPSAIAVGSTTDDDELSSFTNRGPLLDLFAPGTSIVSSVPGGGYASKSGTSMAAPHVAGALAVLRQAFPEKSLAGLESLLKTTGKPITYTGATTPRIDLAKALGQGHGNITDFNGDRVEDIAIADPEATVGGDAKAGLVRVVYGDGKGTLELNQDLPAVPGDAEANDYFGDALATVDYDKDGCTDLVVATSREDIGSAVDAGTVDVIYGSPAGLAAGKATLHLEEGTGSGDILAGVPETGDRMGTAVAAGLTTAQEPYLLIGVPGEDIDGKTDAGDAYYLRGTTDRVLIQGKSGVADTLEAGDKFGSSVAGTPEHLVVGIPGEGVVPYPSGPNAAEVVSGAVEVMSHDLNSSGVPTHVGSVRQTDPMLESGEAEAGDQFGAAVSAAEGTIAMGPFTLQGSYIAIGVPGEDITYAGATKADAGRVVVVSVMKDRNPVVQEVDADYEQTPDAITGAPEAGDRMGAQVSVTNLAPEQPSTASSLLMAVGVPGEDIGTIADAGAVSVFPLIGAPGDNDRWIEAGNATGMPGTPGAAQNVGTSLYGTPTHLYIGMPYGPGANGALYAMPWANATGGTAQPVTTYAPGTGGLAANGLRFGMTAR
ncbi:S8 family serine peptidase [Streptomyces sp. NPDC002742]|uniref:S8 family peptidase n=1 Tax=Streptomyces sp. NPDC002742 TaxID=3364663 RepID=UPI0036852B83